MQFRVCNHGSHIQAPEAKEGEHSHKREKEIGRVVVNKETIAFHWLSCFQEREGSLIFLLGSAISFQGLRASPLISQLYLIKVSMYFIYLFIYFTFTPFDQDLSLKEPLIKS